MQVVGPNQRVDSPKFYGCDMQAECYVRQEAMTAEHDPYTWLVDVGSGNPSHVQYGPSIAYLSRT